MKMTIARYRCSSFAMGTALALSAAPAFAQDATPSNAPPTDAPAASVAETEQNEIVVTATKRGQTSLQQVPIAMSAFTGAQLSARGALDFNDFYHQVPGLAVQDEGPGDKRYVLRGINATGAGTIGIYLDEVIITGENAQDGGGQQPDIKLFDLERVEVLKGPQGTTFGSSSMAGTIRYITAKPKLNDFSATVTTSLKSTKGASLGVQTEGAVNLSIIPDVLAVRVSGLYVDLPGWIDNRFEKGANKEVSKAGRISVRFDPTENLTLTGMAMTQNTHQDAKSFYNKIDFGGNPISQDGYEQADVARAPWKENIDIYNLTGEYRQDFGTFTVTGSRFERHHVFNRDASLAAQAFFGGPYDTTGRSILQQPKQRRIDSFEARFASSFAGPLQVLFGAFSQEEKRTFRSYWPTTNDQGYVEEDPMVFLDRSVRTKIKEKALFGELNYELIDGLKATLGGRYYDFKLREQSSSASAGLLAPTNFDEDGFIPRFNLAYAVTPDINTYVQVAKGYRSGGTNDQTAVELADVSIPAGYGSDSLWNYEAGFKTSWLDRMLTFNAAVYYIKWSDIQVKAQATVTYPDGSNLDFPYTGNGGGADVKGVEFELGLRPMTGLRLGANGNYNSAKLTKDNPAPSVGDDGDRIPYVPKWALSATVDYERPIPSLGVTAIAGADWSYTGARYTEYNDGLNTFHRLSSYNMVNGRIGVETEGWSAMFVVNNIFNDNSIINYNEIVPEYYPDGYYFNKPRTMMLNLTARF
jgi:outer membrane receptor protein involved in Fe transport